MPNKRADDQTVTSFAAPRELLEAARAKARSEGRRLSDVLREALRRYVQREGGS